MFSDSVKTNEAQSIEDIQNASSAVKISLPKGGGAVRSVGEKFTANPVTGAGSTSLAIGASPGRSGFGPQLSLSYDTSAGNSPFGLGWHLALPSIARKTDKGLPTYRDEDESDVFILSGAEDLVPVLVEKDAGNWQEEIVGPRIIDGQHYKIRRYRPRIEGLFARIERWTNQGKREDSFWRSITKDNVQTWYGKTSESRIVDPSDQTRIFAWLICESSDDKGNVISYRYAGENSDNIDISHVHERNRSAKTRAANRYLKRVFYGNRSPYFPMLTSNRPWPEPPGDDAWFFEVVFDYGEHDPTNPTPIETSTRWPVRNDPFSSYRSGFEIRTYRLCQRVLMFHHFPEEPDIGQNCLVRSTDFTYSYEQSPNDMQNPIFSLLLSAAHTSYKRNDADSYLIKSLPPVEFEYSVVPSPHQLLRQPVRNIDPASMTSLPEGLDGMHYHWVDLDGEGLSGILTEQADGWFYKRNLSANHRLTDPETNERYTAARFSAVESIVAKPNTPLGNGHRSLWIWPATARPIWW